MKKQLRMLNNIAAAVAVTLIMVMALLPAGLLGAGELDSEIPEEIAEVSNTPDEAQTTEPTSERTLDPDKTLTASPKPEETTTQEPEASPTQTTTAPPQTTTAPSQTTWTEQAVSGTRYVNTDGIYSREIAVIGSLAVKQYSLNDAVTVVALTSSDYYKLEDGSFIHADYLSDSPVGEPQTEQTEAEEPQPTESEPATREETEPEPSDTEEQPISSDAPAE